MIEQATRQTEEGVKYYPRLVCDHCEEKIPRALDALVLWYSWSPMPGFVHKWCLPSDMASGSGALIEEASIFLYGLLHNVGEAVAAEGIELIRECRIRGNEYSDLGEE